MAHAMNTKLDKSPMWLHEQNIFVWIKLKIHSKSFTRHIHYGAIVQLVKMNSLHLLVSQSILYTHKMLRILLFM